eukprot:753412-Hanusia_phi.AAC.3
MTARLNSRDLGLHLKVQFRRALITTEDGARMDEDEDEDEDEDGEDDKGVSAIMRGREGRKVKERSKRQSNGVIKELRAGLGGSFERHPRD